MKPKKMIEINMCLNSEELEEILDTALSLESKLYYRKNANGYEYRCSICKGNEQCDYHLIKQIISSQVCPLCFNEIKSSKREEDITNKYVCLNDNDGYYVSVKWSFEKGKELLDIKHVLAKRGNELYAKNLLKIGYDTLTIVNKPNWRKLRKGNSYLMCFNKAVRHEPHESKKQYYERIVPNLPYKDNQKYLIKNHLYNKNQCAYIWLFDLKTDEQVQKYSGFMKKQNLFYSMNRIKDYKPMNVYVLEYLNKNNIFISDYADYIKQCEMLNKKVGKPKDFSKEHSKLSEMIADMKNKEYAEMLKDRISEVEKYCYQDNGYQVKAFNSYEELKEVASKLHNCMCANYLKPYVTKKNTILYGTINDEVKFGIEIVNNKVVQLRADRNSMCDKDIVNFVKKWCSEKELVYV